MRLLLLLTWLLLSHSALAHDARPVVINLTQQPHNIQMHLTIPDSLPEKGLPHITISQCKTTYQSPVDHSNAQYQLTSLWQCEDGLEGQQVSIVYPYFNPSLSAVISIRLASGAGYSALLSPENRNWQIPNKEQIGSVVESYIAMGFSHIMEGWDHLLFVLCLTLLASNARQLLLSVTGFTLGHSITLALGALNIVHVPAPVFEALIALSLIILAVELIQRNRASWTLRFPILVTASFGLLHGLGFASVLQEIGLPQTQLIWGLISFNLGIELGQLSFIAVVVLVIRLLHQKAQMRYLLSAGYRPLCYTIGLLASFWFWERTYFAFFTSLLS